MKNQSKRSLIQAIFAVVILGAIVGCLRLVSPVIDLAMSDDVWLARLGIVALVLYVPVTLVAIAGLTKLGEYVCKRVVSGTNDQTGGKS